MSRAPEILDEFSPRNRKRPDEIHYCTVKKAWWKCRECGYEWRTSVYARTRLGEGCPRCKGRKA